MEYVQPIRDKNKIEQFKAELRIQGDRDYMLGYFGLNTGLRIGDIINLTVSNIKGQDKLYIKEQKTNKVRFIPLSDFVMREIERYIKFMPDNAYLFPSREGGAITRSTAYRIIHGAAKKCGIENISPHSLRKTFGYFHYKKHHDVALLQMIFGHSSPSITLRYIGISQDEIAKSIREMDEL